MTIWKSPLRIAPYSIAILIAIAFAISPLALASSFPPKSGIVTHVFDGDTLKVKSAGKSYKVRVLGIDTPETKGPYTRQEPFGPQASARTRILALGKTVRLDYDSTKHKDRFGRLLAYVTLPDGRDLGGLLISEGLAEAFHSTSYGRKKIYHQLQEQARAARRGIWSLPQKSK